VALHMPDFDANEEYARLPGPGQDGQPEPVEERPPIVRRVRQQLDGHASRRHYGTPALVERRRAYRRACPAAGRAVLPGAPSRRSRRLWATSCHGRHRGSQS